MDGRGDARGCIHPETADGAATSDAVVPRGRGVRQTDERSFLLGEGRRGRGVRAGDKFRGRAVDHSVVDGTVPGVVHGGGCVDGREQVEGWNRERRRVTGRGGRSRAVDGRAVE